MNAEEAVERGVLVVALERLGTLVVTGPERRTWLQGMVTCDVQDLEAGRGRHGLVLSRTGKIITDTNLVTTSRAFYLSVERGVAAATFTHLDRLLVMEEAEVAERSAQYEWLALLGPQAATQAQSVVARTPEVATSTVRWQGLAATLLVVPRPRLQSVVAGVLQAGAESAHRAAPEDWERIRVQRNIVRFGLDYDQSHTAHEASLEHSSVSFTKGCYVGQEIVARQQARGHSLRRLVWLRVSSAAPPPPGAEVCSVDDRQVVGQVTSCALGRFPGRSCAIARVRSAHAGLGTRLRVGEVEATVADANDA